MVKSRSTRLALGLGAVSMALAACGGGSSGGSPSPSSTASGATPGNATSGTINFGAAPIAQTNLRQTLINAFEKKYPHIKVNLVSLPTSADAQQAALTTQISGGSGPDVYIGDVVWPAQFGAHGLALAMNKYLPTSYWQTFAPGLVKGATYKNQVYGAPFFADQGLLFYRKDLLAQHNMAVPKTWEQLASEAKKLQNAKAVKYGFVWQGASYEGLTANWAEYLADAGGSVLNSTGSKSAMNSPAALRALKFMRSLITSGVSPAAEPTFQEPQSSDVFYAGQAAFLRFWPNAYKSSNTAGSSQVVGKVGVAPLPTFAGQSYPGYSTVGGQNLYVNPHSSNIAADLTFVKWMTGTQAQTMLTTQFSEIPTNQAVRTAPSITSQNPVLAVIAKTKLAPRPSFTPNYPKVSQAIYSNINAALAGSASPQAALSTAQRQINAAVAGTGL